MGLGLEGGMYKQNGRTMGVKGKETRGEWGVYVVGGGGGFEVKVCTEDTWGFGGVKRINIHVVVKRPVALYDQHAG